MSEFEKSPEQYAEFISIVTPFESIEQLKKIFSEGKMLCWSYKQDDFRLKIWYRENDSYENRVHKIVDPRADIGGYLSITRGVLYGAELVPRKFTPNTIKNAIKHKLYSSFS